MMSHLRWNGERFSAWLGRTGRARPARSNVLKDCAPPAVGRFACWAWTRRATNIGLRPRIGVQLQESALQDRLKVWEALDLFASFYPRSVDKDALLEQVGLTEKLNAPFAKLSGGQKQRLFLALALVHDPEIVFLDELTTGLDPQARRT